jgi:hypothetical protein
MLGVVGMAAAAQADLSINFEAPLYNGSAAGTILTGQDGWTRPAGIDGNVHTYAGNSLGLGANWSGGRQFMGTVSTGGTNFARGQHTNDFTTQSIWELSYDFAAVYLGVAPSAANLSSFSLQDSVAARSFIALNNFMDNANPANGWKAQYNVFNAAGAALATQSAGAGWENLAVNHWYRQTTVVDFATNAILWVRLMDLDTGTSVSVNPTGWYMSGGATPGARPIPTAIRMFGGGQAGNAMGWDNLSVVPTPGAASLLLGGLVGLSRRRK